MKRPAEFTRLVGVSPGTFQIILEKLEAEILRFKRQKPIRQRGLKSSLTIADQLLLTLIYLRQYHTFLQLAEMFSISESYAHKRYTFTSGRLLKALDLPNDKSLTMDNLKLVIDVTEQEIERPVRGQRSFYSGKKATHDKKSAGRLLFHRFDPCHEKCPRHAARFSNPEEKRFENQSQSTDQGRLRISRNQAVIPAFGSSREKLETSSADAGAKTIQSAISQSKNDGRTSEPQMQDLSDLQRSLSRKT